MNASQNGHVREYRKYCVIRDCASSSANREIDVLETLARLRPKVQILLRNSSSHTAQNLQQYRCNM